MRAWNAEGLLAVYATYILVRKEQMFESYTVSMTSAKSMICKVVGAHVHVDAACHELLGQQVITQQ